MPEVVEGAAGGGGGGGGGGGNAEDSPAVEGGVGDDGDVRGELAPDPAEKNREILVGTKTDI